MHSNSQILIHGPLLFCRVLAGSLWMATWSHGAGSSFLLHLLNYMKRNTFSIWLFHVRNCCSCHRYSMWSWMGRESQMAGAVILELISLLKCTVVHTVKNENPCTSTMLGLQTLRKLFLNLFPLKFKKNLMVLALIKALSLLLFMSCLYFSQTGAGFRFAYIYKHLL